jgi:hypothetical protein
MTVRKGQSLRTTARQWSVSVATVWEWVRRAGTRRLDRVDWASRMRGNPRPMRTSAEIERHVLDARMHLRRHSALGEYGAAAIRHRLLADGCEHVPCERTIHRILERNALVTVGRQRRPPPPVGWYLPTVASGQHELDSFDFVEGYALAGGRHFDVLNGISLWGNLSVSNVLPRGATWSTTLEAISSHWLRRGAPHVGQFDNDSIFQGSHGHFGNLGRIVHACLCLGVIPVFAPPREIGFQAKIEAFNRRWQDVVWRRRRFRSYAQLQQATDRFVDAHHAKHCATIERVERRPVPPLHEARIPVVHTVTLLRRSDAHARVELLHQRFQLPSWWQHRLVRCEISLLEQSLRCFALRRKTPDEQPLLLTKPITAKLTPWHAQAR